MEEYWLKYGFKESGELVCVRTLSTAKPDKHFFYTESGENKEVLDPDVIKISRETICSLR